MICLKKKKCDLLRKCVKKMDLSNVVDYDDEERSIEEKRRSFFSGYSRELISMIQLGVPDDVQERWYKNIYKQNAPSKFDFIFKKMKYEVKPFYTDDWKGIAKATSFMTNPEFDFLVLVYMENGKIMFNENDIKGEIHASLPRDVYLANYIIKEQKIFLPKEIVDLCRYKK